MAAFRRRRRDTIEAWPLGLVPEELQDFRAGVAEAVAPYGGKVDEETLRMGGSTYPLESLAREWVSRPSHARPTFLAHHFLQLEGVHEVERLPDRTVLGRLRPRLVAAGARTLIDTVTVPLAQGLAAALCVDRPDSLVPLTPGRAEATGRRTEDLWDLAVAQIDDGKPVTGLPSHTGVSGLTGTSLFVASRLLDMPRYVGPLPPEGAVVAIPNRQTLAYQPLSGRDAPKGATAVARLGEDMFGGNPQRITPWVYWWRPDQPLERVPTRRGERGLVLDADDELAEILLRLSPPAALLGPLGGADAPGRRSAGPPKTTGRTGPAGGTGPSGDGAARPAPPAGPAPREGAAPLEEQAVRPGRLRRARPARRPGPGGARD